MTKLGWLLLVTAGCFSDATALAEAKPKRAGQIIITGNTVTRDYVVRYLVGLYPGQVVQYPDLRIAEKNLAKSGLFKIDAANAIRPTITILEDPNNPDAEFVDILVQVQEREPGPQRLFRQLYWRLRAWLSRMPPPDVVAY